jgi:hypothetical protein
MERVEFKLTGLENSLKLAVNNSVTEANNRAASLQANNRAVQANVRAERMEALLEKILEKLG